MKKMLMILGVCTILFSFTLTSFAVTFSDVPADAWYKDYVYNLVEKEVINGYPDGTYKPDDKVTIGAFLKLIVTASAPNIKYDLVEPDYDHWAAPYLKVAENFGVLEEGEYKGSDLDREITRMELVNILTKCDITVLGNPQRAADLEFLDIDDITDDERVYLSHAVGVGVINGDPTGTFRPFDGLKRSECAKVIYTYTNR